MKYTSTHKSQWYVWCGIPYIYHRHYLGAAYPMFHPDSKATYMINLHVLTALHIACESTWWHFFNHVRGICVHDGWRIPHGQSKVRLNSWRFCSSYIYKVDSHQLKTTEHAETHRCNKGSSIGRRLSDVLFCFLQPIMARWTMKSCVGSEEFASLCMNAFADRCRHIVLGA